MIDIILKLMTKEERRLFLQRFLKHNSEGWIRDSRILDIVYQACEEFEKR